MSICYDFEKWTMISLVSVAVSLTIGLVTLAYGQETETPLEMIKQYCLDHVDRILAGGDPVQDLINVGLIPRTRFENITCQNVDLKIFQKQSRDELRQLFK
jgi:hypothetical protein